MAVINNFLSLSFNKKVNIKIIILELENLLTLNYIVLLVDLNI